MIQPQCNLFDCNDPPNLVFPPDHYVSPRPPFTLFLLLVLTRSWRFMEDSVQSSLARLQAQQMMTSAQTQSIFDNINKN